MRVAAPYGGVPRRNVLAVVLYNGEREWVEALDTRERIALYPGSEVEGCCRGCRSR